MIVTHKITMDLARHGVTPRVDAVQDDKYSRDLEISLYSGGTPWEPPSGTKAVVRYIKSDGKGGEYDTMPDGASAYSISGNAVTVKLAPQVLTVEGPVYLTVGLVKSTQEISAFPILIWVHKNFGAQISDSDDYYNGGGESPEPVLQVKSVTPSTSMQTVTPDAGYDGLESVTVAAIKTETKHITANGTFTPTGGAFFSEVTVDVQDIGLEVVYEAAASLTLAERYITSGGTTYSKSQTYSTEIALEDDAVVLVDPTTVTPTSLWSYQGYTNCYYKISGEIYYIPENADIAELNITGYTGTVTGYKIVCRNAQKVVVGTADSGGENLSVTGLEAAVTEFSGINDAVQSYLAAAESYTDDDRSVSVVEDYVTTEQEYTDSPAGVKITNTTTGTLYVLDESTGDCYEKAVSSVKERTIQNLVPGHIYTWFVRDADGAVGCSGRVKQTGTLRMLEFSGLYNARDLGGWNCSGGTVKYGKLFRGAAFGNASDTAAIEYAGQLGIRREVDLRIASEHSLTESLLGTQIHYENYPIEAYYRDLIADTSADRDNLVSALRSIMESARHNEPVYFHCSVGADRTGVIAYLLEGLLGVSKSDMDRDYELTSFYPYGEQVRSRTKSEYNAMVDYLDTFDGDTFREKVASWFASAGFSYETLNAFCTAMVDGTPAELAAPAGPSYTNLIPTSEALDSTAVYNNGLGYKDGAYISSGSGGDGTKSGHVTTGMIAYTVKGGVTPETIYIKGGKPDRIGYYLSDKTFKLTYAFADMSAAWTVEELNTDYWKLTPLMKDDGSNNSFLYVNQGSGGYLRFDVTSSAAADLIITLDEPIA